MAMLYNPLLPERDELMSFVVISKVVHPAHLKQEIQAVGLEMLPVARSQDGVEFSLETYERIG